MGVPEQNILGQYHHSQDGYVFYKGKNLGHTTRMEDAGEGYAKVGGQVYFHGEAVGSAQTVQNLRGGYATANGGGHNGGDLYYMGKRVASFAVAKKFEHINDDWAKFAHGGGKGTIFLHRGQQMNEWDAYKAGCPRRK